MAFYISELLFDYQQYWAQRLHSVYVQHLAVYTLFDNVREQQSSPQGTTSGILWVDKGSTGNAQRFLILSDRLPRENHQQILNTKLLPDTFFTRDQYRFEVVINPVWRRSSDGKLQPVIGRQDIFIWFCQQAQKQWGFAVSPRSLQVDNVCVRQFYKNRSNSKDNAKHEPVTLQQATLTGMMTVTDKTRFQHSVVHGIGRGRSFGCGLLQVIPVN